MIIVLLSGSQVYPLEDVSTYYKLKVALWFSEIKALQKDDIKIVDKVDTKSGESPKYYRLVKLLIL